jgi:hypothetical protein
MPSEARQRIRRLAQIRVIRATVDARSCRKEGIAFPHAYALVGIFTNQPSE